MSSVPVTPSAGPGPTATSAAAPVLRAMTSADLPAVLALWRSLEHEGLGLSPEETEPMLTAYLARNPGLSVVALAAPAADEPGSAGTIVGAMLAGHDGRRGVLYHLAVAPAARGRGLGRALVEFSMAGLHAAGIAKASVMVYADNAAGRAFWSRLGWRARPDLVLMQKTPAGPFLET